MMTCPNCGNPISGNFCQTCGQNIVPVYTQAPQPMPPMAGPPPPAGDVTVVVAIVVVVVVIVAVLAAFFLIFSRSPVFLGGIDYVETTPTGALSFSESTEIPGEYSLMYMGSVELNEIEIMVFDASLGDSILFNPTIETFAQIQGGLNITYNDINSNFELDAADLILIQGGAPGDTITVIYIPTGGTVARATLT